MVLYASLGFDESITNTETQFVQATTSSSLMAHGGLDCHDDVIKWTHFPHYWPFVRGIHRWPVNSPQKGQWRGALMFSLICAWINGWVNNRDVIVMVAASHAVRDVSIGIMAMIVFSEAHWSWRKVHLLYCFQYYMMRARKPTHWVTLQFVSWSAPIH